MTQVDLLPFEELLANVTDSTEIGLLRRAYQFAAIAHDGRIRPSGEQYIAHDLAVAQIMQDLGVDAPTLAACLLHDSLLPHTQKTEEDVALAFGNEIAALVRGLNQLLSYTAAQQLRQQVEQHEIDVEGIRRAIIAIIEGDIRIILIRMADCLHDLRRAGRLDEEPQREIAAEVMNIYAPLANRLGIWQLKWELEDLSFRYMEPEKYRMIASKLASRRASRDSQLQGSVQILRQKIKESGLKATVSGRSKHIFSIYRKMERKKINFENIYDVQAIRIILDSSDPEAYEKMSSITKDEEDRSLCYQAIAIVHGLWERIPGEYDDYISQPKANGYRSLHTAVVDTSTGQTLEVQIRTARMHQQAERGVAAHWAYKEGSAIQVSASVQKRIKNLRHLLTSLQETDNRGETADQLDNEVLVERIHVYTPNGDVVDLPVGATPIDFAYQIHTQVGHRCRGARVNGKMVGLDYQLRSGQRVEILTIKKSNPSRDWLNPSLGYTQSGRTRSKIRQWYRTQERDQNIIQGRDVVEREIKRLGLLDLLQVEDIARALRISDLQDFLAQVGFGDITTAQINGAIAVLVRDLEDDDTEEELKPLLLKVPRKQKGLTVKGVSGLHTRIGKCCQPLPPELIIGFITRGKGVTIHRQDCQEVRSISESSDRNRLIDVEWGSEDSTHPVPIVIRAYRRANLIDDMVSILRGRQIQVPKTKTISSGGLMTIYLVVEITDLEQLSWLLKKFEGLNNVVEVKRERWDD